MSIFSNHTAYCITCVHKFVGLLLCITIGIILLYFAAFKTKQNVDQRKQGYRGKELSKSIIILSILAITFYCISLSSVLIGDIYIDSIYWLGIPYAITSITWATANSFVYLTFMKRTYNVFCNTAYASPFSTYIILLIVIFIYFDCEIAFFTLEIYNFFDPDGISDDTKFKIETIVAVIEVIADITISFCLTTLFVRKLLSVALATFDRDELYDQHKKSLMRKMSFSDEIEVNSAQQTLLHIITKQTILAAIGTFATQIWLMYYVPLVMIWSFGKDNTTNELYALHVLSEFMMVTDCSINALCILLAFAFFKTYYHLLCGFCHKCCLRRCIAFTKRRVARELSMQHRIEMDSYKRLHDVNDL
eukprot:200045_1